MPPVLPPDDDGPADGELVSGPSTITVPVKKPRGKAKSKSKKGKSSEPPVEVPGPSSLLPPDDDGHLDIYVTNAPKGGKRHAPKQGAAKANVAAQGKPKKIKSVKDGDKVAEPSHPKSSESPELIDNHCFPWNDQRLKDAATRFPSIIEMPYLDLSPMYLGQTPPLSNHDRCDLWEIYSMPRLGPCIRSLGGQCRRSYDIQHFWDLASTDYKRVVIQDLSLLRPKFLMLSPPCRYVSLLMASNWSRMKKLHEKMLCLEEALGHLDMSMWMAQFQILHNALFAFEHPIGSLAWKRDSVTSA